MKKYQNHSETTETFITDDGNVVKYQDVFKGIEAQTRYYASKNRKNYGNGDADDVFQDAAYRAVAYHSGYNSDKSKPRTYGSMIANSCARDAYRSDMRRAMIFTSLESEFEFEDDGYKAEKCMYNEYKDDEFGADCTIRENEASKYIEGKIATLRRDYQTVIKLAMQDYDTNDIAEELNWDKNKVYRTLCRARAALAELLGPSFLKENGFSKVMSAD